MRLIPHFETNPRVVTLAQTTAGKVVLLGTFGLAQRGFSQAWLIELSLLSLITFLPRARRLLVTAGTLIFTNFFWFQNSVLTRFMPDAGQLTRTKEFIWIVLPFMLFCLGLMWVTFRYPRSIIGRRPLLFLLGIYAALGVTASYAALPGFPRFALWGFLFLFCSYFWFLAYAMWDRASAHGDRILYQVGTFHPFWGSSNVPIPKGSGHWRTIEAKTPEELAITMIKGVKLMVWCLLLTMIKTYYEVCVYQKFKVPIPAECLDTFFAGKPLPWIMNWLSWPADLLHELLTISVFGHALIAVCRMAGFRALRNTYAPLSSRTVAEYWNRYYYYFKELMVDMFFYPTFVRYFKRSPRIRIFVATFAAASFGNTLYHFLRDVHIVVNQGLLYAVLSFKNYFFYSLLLALGISASQLRSRSSQKAWGWFRQRVTAPVCVLGFYCMAHIFELSSPVTGIRYLAYLFSGRY